MNSEALAALLAPGVEALGFELLAVEWAGAGGQRVLRVYIDGPQGITVEDCADVSEQLSGILDVEDPIPGPYQLEVSSPGADRPLVRPAHFARFRGHEVRVRLRVPRQGRRRWRGRLVASDERGIELEVDGERQHFALADIERARLVPEFEQ